VATLLVSVLLTTVALVALTVSGWRWQVPAARPIVLALAVYAAAALGLDAGTAAAVAAQSHAGALTAATSTFIEEFGEAVTALLLVVTVRWHLPDPPAVVDEIGDAGQSVRQQ
jgi:hypothetical protein